VPKNHRNNCFSDIFKVSYLLSGGGVQRTKAKLGLDWVDKSLAGRLGKPQPLAVTFVAPVLPYGELADYPAASPPGNRFQHGVLNALVAHGIDTSVISLRPVSSYPRGHRMFFRDADGSLGESVPYRKIGFINAGPIKTLTVAFTSFLAIWRWAQQHRGKRRVMLFYNAYNPSAWVGVLAAWLTRSKVITIVADVRVPGSGGGDPSLLRRIEYQIAVASLRHMDAIVAVTRRIAVDLAAGVPFLLLDGGVPEDMLEPLPAPALHKNAGARDKRVPGRDQFVVLYAGSLSHLAGVPLLLQAFQRLADARFCLWIIGGGEQEPEVCHAAATDTRIRYFCKLSRSELLATYAAADVLVNPHSTLLQTSRYVFPSKLLEYLASGRPVITTATPEIAADYGDLCTVLDREEPEALAEAILRVAAVSPGDRLAAAAVARVAVIERRAWSRQGERLVRFLEELSLRFDESLPSRELSKNVEA
jgi:glycosyltransferase involved in cell wall biosynthesis